MVPPTKIKAVLDLRGMPPAFYALETDGCTWKYKQRVRRDVILHLASYANPDGTGITVGTKNMAAALGLPLRTLYRFLDDLTNELCFLESDGLDGRRGTRVRRINWEAVWERQAQGMQGVHKATKECITQGQGMHNAATCPATECITQPRNAKPPEFWQTTVPTATPTGFSDRPENQPPQNGGMAVGGGGGVEDMRALPAPAGGGSRPPEPPPTSDDDEDEEDYREPTEAELAAQQASWEQHVWENFMAQLPAAMHGAVMTEDQRKQVWAQVQKYPVDRLLAAIKRWIEVRDMPVDDCRTKWRAWLLECEPCILWVKNAAIRKRAEQLKAKAAAAATEAAAQRAAEKHEDDHVVPEQPAAPQPGGIEDYFKE